MTFGRSAANFFNDARAAFQSIVNGVGGRARSRLRLSNALHESMFTVTRSRSRHNLAGAPGQTGIKQNPFAAGPAKKKHVRETHRQPTDVGRDPCDQSDWWHSR